jgi:hypothetical protein
LLVTAMSEADSTAALAAQVADLRTKLLLVQAWQMRHEDLNELPGQVGDLAALVTDLLDNSGPVMAAPYWLGLSDTDYETELADLSEWVGKVLKPNYPAYSRVIRECWPQHQEVVWELGNIRAEWRRIYERKRPELAGALNWHDRWLPGCLARIEPLMRACNAARCSQDREADS